MSARNSLDLDQDPRATFEDLGGKTRLTMRGEFPSAAERARVVKDYGAEKGLEQTLARLEAYVVSIG